MSDEYGENNSGQFNLGVIKDISGYLGSGLWQIYFEDGGYCNIESGHGLRVMSQVYNGLENAIGKAIEYKAGEMNVMISFRPVESLTNELFKA